MRPTFGRRSRDGGAETWGKLGLTAADYRDAGDPIAVVEKEVDFYAATSRQSAC